MGGPKTSFSHADEADAVEVMSKIVGLTMQTTLNLGLICLTISS